MRKDAPILHRSHSTPAPTLHRRASSGTGAQIMPLMPSRVKSEKPADEDDILDYSVWEKEVEALSARVQRLASISRCPELVAVARQHSRKAEQVRVVRTAEPVMVRRRFWRFFRPRRELEEYPDAEQKKEKKLLEKQEQKQKKEAARAEKKKKKLIGKFAHLAPGWVAAVQPVLPDGWFLMEQLHGPRYYWHESGAASLQQGCI